MAQQVEVKDRQERSARSRADRVEVAAAAGHDDGSSQRDAGRRGVGWRVGGVLAAVVVAVGAWFAISGDDAARQVVSNADEARALQGEKAALVAGSQDLSDAWRAYAARLSGQAEQELAKAARQDEGDALVVGAAAAADKANALRKQDSRDRVHDGAAAAAAANARVADSDDVAAANVAEREASDRLIARGLVPAEAFDRDQVVLDDLVARGLVPRADHDGR